MIHRSDLFHMSFWGRARRKRLEREVPFKENLKDDHSNVARRVLAKL